MELDGLEKNQLNIRWARRRKDDGRREQTGKKMMKVSGAEERGEQNSLLEFNLEVDAKFFFHEKKKAFKQEDIRNEECFLWMNRLRCECQQVGIKVVWKEAVVLGEE
jgi:hypothetical protein